MTRISTSSSTALPSAGPIIDNARRTRLCCPSGCDLADGSSQMPRAARKRSFPIPRPSARRMRCRIDSFLCWRFFLAFTVSFFSNLPNYTSRLNPAPNSALFMRISAVHLRLGDPSHMRSRQAKTYKLTEVLAGAHDAQKRITLTTHIAAKGGVLPYEHTG